MPTLKIVSLAAVLGCLAMPAFAQDRSMVYDVDGDMALSETEFANGPMRLGNFGQFDRDSSGSVDFAEFMKGISDKLEGMRDSGTLTPSDARELQIAVMAFN